MTQEQKARAYDRAFKEAKAIHNFSSNIAEIKRMEQIFPELAESEDEKVRKALIKYFSEGREYLSLIPYNKEECVAWLEKQGEKMFDQRYRILTKLIEADDIYQMSVNDAMVKEAKNKAIEALSNLEISKLLGLEKQGVKEISELAKSEDKQIMKEIAEFIYNSAFKPKDIKKKEKWLTWLEKQSEKSLTVDIESMIEAYEQRLLSQCNGVRNSPIVNMCVEAFKHGAENTLDELHLRQCEQEAQKTCPYFERR